MEYFNLSVFISSPGSRIVSTYYLPNFAFTKQPSTGPRDVFIMEIELSGVQFGLNSNAWFQNQTSAQRGFDFQTKIARPEVQLPLYYIHFEIAQFNSLNTRTTRSVWSLPLYIELVAGLSKSETRNTFTSHFENISASDQRDVIASCDWLFCFTVLFSLADKKMRSR